MQPHEVTFILDDSIADIIDTEQIDATPQTQTESIQPEKIESIQRYKQLASLHKQLVIRLKFHHAETIQQLPLNVALRAMEEVWYSCVNDSLSKDSLSNDVLKP